MSSSLVLNQIGNWSFYIPYVPTCWDEESIRRLFADLQIGKVERVDFINTQKWEWAVSAFVHLDEWCDTLYTKNLYDELEYGSGQWRLDIPGQYGKYFVLKKMTTEKIPSTELNVHQLANKMSGMEQEIQALRDDIQGFQLASSVAENVLREDLRDENSSDMDIESADFYYKYADPLWGSLSMEELAVQTSSFTKWRGNTADGVHMDVDSDDSSQSSTASSSKRMQMSNELCGNN